LLKKWMLRLSAIAIRLDCWLRRVDPPYCLVPKGGQAVLEAHHHHHHQSNRRMARFGITTVRGPPAQPIRDSVERIYSITTGGAAVGTAAIIYMFVEEPFRNKNVATLALQVISTIHSLQGCDFTILVADDNGSGKLVRWYERHGFSRAPLLQDMLGSPEGKYGIAMIAPTRNEIDPLCRINWW
jgi:GNAT superfamily N-acetyltransferase